MDKDDILRKIGKCLALAKSSEPRPLQRCVRRKR